MIRSKFVKRALCAFLASAMMVSFAGCGKKGAEKGMANNTNEARQIVNYFIPSEFEMPEEMGYTRDVFYANDMIYIWGEGDSSTSEKLIQTVDLATKEAVDVDLSALDFQNISTIKMSGGKIYVTYYDSDYYMKLAVLDASTNKVLAETDNFESSYIVSSNIDKDGNLAAVVMSYGIGKETSKLVTYDSSTLKVISEFDCSEKLSLGNNEYLAYAMLEDDGSVVALIVDYSGDDDMAMKLCKLNTDMEVEYISDDFSDMEGYPCGLSKSNGKLLIVSTSNYSKYYINEVSLETGEVTGRYEASLGDDVYIPEDVSVEGYDFVYKAEDGFFGYKLAEGKSEPILKFGTDIAQDYENCYTVSSYGSANGDSLILYTEVYGEGGREKFMVYDMDGNFVRDIPFVTSQKNSYITSATITPEGKILLAEQSSSFEIDEDDEDAERNYTSSYTIHILDGDGNEEKTIDLGSFDDDTYLQDIKAGKNGNIYMTLQSWSEDDGSCYAVRVYDADGNLKATIKDSENMDYINAVISTDDGDYIKYQDKKDYKNVFAKIDYEKNALGDAVDIGIGENSNILNTWADGYDFCYRSSDGLYGYNIGSGTSTEIINWIDSDIVGSVNSVAIAGNDKLVITMYDYESGSQKVSVLDRADEETLKKIQNKQIITVAGFGISYSDMQNRIYDFNKNSNEYRIQVNDYEKYSTYEDNEYRSGASKLNSDIASGNIPDVIIGDYEIDMSAYAAKGLLTDINPLIEKDEEFSKEDYIENIFDLYSSDGKLYQLVTSFTLRTLVGKASVLGSESGWTFDEFFEIADSKSPMFYDQQRNTLMNLFIKENLSEFVDFKEKKCDFNNDNFVKLLEFIKKEGKSEDDDKNNFGVWDEDKWKEQLARFRDNKCQVENMTMYGFSNLLDLQQGAIGEEVALKGVPSKDKNGNLISAVTTIGITEKSKKKDAAWAFVREFITEEYQDEMNDGDYVRYFPVMKSSFDKVIKKAQNAETYKHYLVNTPDGEYKEMKPLDAQTAEKVKNIIYSANRAVISDTRINDIIDEQVNIFFEGGQSAQETAEAIQNKASLYLKEIK